MSRDFIPRPTTYKGIDMRSRLEAGYAAWLDRRGCAWEYEPKAFAGEHGQYLPDFMLRNSPCILTETGRADIYIEVKYEGWFRNDASVEDVYRMLCIHESEPKAILVLQQPDEMWVVNPPGASEELHLYRAMWVSPSVDLGVPTLALGYAEKALPWHGEWWKAVGE